MRRVDFFVTLPSGAYCYDAANHALIIVVARLDRPHAAIAEALGLTHDQQVLLSQAVGYPELKSIRE